MRRPRVWSPARPYLYNVNLRASAGGRSVGSYRLRTGIRSIRVSSDGHLILNGQRVNLRGVGVHEDSKEQGFAVDNAFRQRLVTETKAAGATLMRTHYPMHPYTHELADREGVMIWSEVPVYAIKTANLAKNLVTTLAAKELEKNIIANQNHPSVLRVVDRQRAVRAPRPDAGELHQERRPPGEGARPQPPGRHRGRGLSHGRLPEGLQRRST